MKTIYTSSLILLLVLLNSCQGNTWSEIEKNNFVSACATAYQQTSGDSTDFANCFCEEALKIAMTKYSNGTEADNKATVKEMQEMSEEALKIAEIKCN